MNHAQNLHTVHPIKPLKRSVGISATVDLTAGGGMAAKALIRFIHGADSSTQVWRVGHVSASTTLYASATAFNTAIVVSAATSAQKGYIVDLTNAKRYLRIKQSAPSGSGVGGVIVDLFYHRVIPSGSTQLQGFTSLSSTYA